MLVLLDRSLFLRVVLQVMLMVRFLLVMDGIDSSSLQRSPSVSLLLELVLLPIVLLVLSPGLVMATQVSTFGVQNSPSLPWILILQPAVRSSIPITSSISRTLLWICSMDSSHSSRRNSHIAVHKCRFL